MSRMVALGRWTRFVLLGLVAVIAVVLIVSALTGGGAGTGGDAAAEPVPSPTATIEPVAEATPTPTPEAAEAADPERRFLAMDPGGVLWRGVAGSCAAGVAPKLESTTDAVSWRTATPDGAAELLALAPGDAAGQASVVVALDDGSCTAVGRRTAPDGSGWQDAPEALAAWDAAAPAVPDGHLAATVEGERLFVARTAPDCEGVAFAVLPTDGGEPAPDGWRACEPGLDPAAPIAIDHADGRLYVWSGDVLTGIDAS